MTGFVAQLLSAPAWLALLVVFALPALESSAFLGFVFPGELAVLLGGVAAGDGRIPLAGALAAGIGGAAVGDAVGYLVGRRWGRRILDSTLGRFIQPARVRRAEHTLATRGAWTVLVGRFTVALRVMVPGLAGMARMPYRRFTAANVAGGVLWGTAMVLAGYLAGSSWHTVERYVSVLGLSVTATVVALLVLGRGLARRRSRDAADTSPAEALPAPRSSDAA